MCALLSHVKAASRRHALLAIAASAASVCGCRAFLPTQNENTTDCRQVCIVFLFILLLLLTSWKKAYYTSKYNMPFYSGLPRPFDKSRISPHLPGTGRPSPAQEAGPTGLRPVVAVTITQRWCRYPEWTASPQDPEHTCHLHMPAM